jgi:DNA polymerase (family 10)
MKIKLDIISLVPTKDHIFSNEQILTLLKEVVAAMEVKNVSFFRIRAYQQVISSIEDLTISVYDLWKQNRLSDIQGIGETLERHLNMLFTTGHVKDFDEVKKDLPLGMFALLGLRGIGAKKAFRLSSEFNLDNRSTALDLLKKAAKEGKIRVLDGFGEKSELAILSTLENQKKHKNSKERMLLSTAESICSRLLAYLQQNEHVLQVNALGSLRRRESTVGDLDIAIATNNPSSVIDHFTKFSEVAEVTAKGDSRAAVILRNEVQVDIRVSEPNAYGAMLQYFTGSKAHNIALRNFALDKKLSLSEYGIKSAQGEHKFSTEEEFYSFLGLPLIPPEIRQGRNEVELAVNKSLPDLIGPGDIKGDLHMHTTDSDGANSLEEMVQAAHMLNYEYIAITDHNPSVKINGSFDVLSVLHSKKTQIEQINSSQTSLRVLFGYEVDVLKSGELALPNSMLKQLDFAIASIHSNFDMPRNEITKRLISAIRNPYIKILGHPSGRLLTKRAPMDLDWEVIFEEVKKEGKILEINAHPSRLDLADDLVYEATRHKIPLIINTDAHATSELNNMHYGVDVARRGWCTKEHIINTKNLNDFLKTLL